MALITVGSLFAGIGGLEKGLEDTGGFETKWQVENDPYAIKVLEKHWPDVKRRLDARAFCPPAASPWLLHKWLEDLRAEWYVDLICAGFPCQPFSQAGQRKGEADKRNLWPSTFRVLEILRPQWVLLENVAALRNPARQTPGPARPSYFGRVLGDLASLGYYVRWDCIPAAAVGAPHIRDRVFIVAHADATIEHRPRQITKAHEPRRLGSVIPDTLGRSGDPGPERTGREAGSDIGGGGAGSVVADTNRNRRNEMERKDRTTAPGPGIISPSLQQGFGDWRSDWWDVEPSMGRVADGVPSRVDRLRCLGNSVVRQVTELIGNMILESLK